MWSFSLPNKNTNFPLLQLETTLFLSLEYSRSKMHYFEFNNQVHQHSMTTLFPRFHGIAEFQFSMDTRIGQADMHSLRCHKLFVLTGDAPSADRTQHY